MSTIKVGIVGCGVISGCHLERIARDTGPALDLKLAGLCDIVLERAEKRRAEFGRGNELVTTDYRELLDSGIDAVVVATPHPSHAEISIEAFRRNIHVMCEKPVAVTAAEARRMNAARRKSKSVFTIHFQHRQNPRNKWIKAQVEAGLLGPLQKLNVLWNHWYRTQAYYDSGTWRGSWTTEGGGVLMNQCPHDLDLFTWWFGSPETVDAKMWLGRCHEIEVEDDVIAIVRFKEGGVGIINASTCDHPASGRWEAIGDRGKLLIDGDAVKAWKLAEGLSLYTLTTKEIWEGPKAEEVPAPEFKSTWSQWSSGTWTNFIKAIRGEEKLWVDGEEGVKSLELANAITASGFLGKPVSLPLDEKLFDDVLRELRAGKSGAALHPSAQKRSR